MTFEEKFKQNEFAIEVSPEQLCHKAVQIKQICDDMLTHMENVDKCIHDLSNNWQSNAEIKILQFYNEDKVQLEKASICLKKQATRLETIADNYEESEKNAENDILGLNAVLK